ncbi:MAG: ABC transporter permease [Gemmatimonadetes bacterium]|nr:ABC transporter permease [Gemmatimonadota bacterium]MBT6145973.1 ABC transporter permease [Gemmatimonadota bacterium]MBT7858975.1 ABC transporter permease [Gemmatimonadota bacterium]
MATYILRRFLIMIPTLLVVSAVTFAIIQLPPGDFVTTLMSQLEMSGEPANLERAQNMRAEYGLDLSFWRQYARWMGFEGLFGGPTGLLQLNFGQSFKYNTPVNTLIWERIALTITIAFTSIIVTWIIALPIGFYSAIRQYGIMDYSATLLGFLGMSTPQFFFALVMLFVANRYFDISAGGLFSDEYIDAAWSLAKVWDLLLHLWVPVLVLSIAGTGGTIRTMRANLLDQLEMPYVTTARAKGLNEWWLLVKYPVRLAINPMISTIGWMLPTLISGSVIVSIVLSLPTTGPLLYEALTSQDMFLAGSFLMILSFLTMVGTLISDILLAWVDPRIRFDSKI